MDVSPKEAEYEFERLYKEFTLRISLDGKIDIDLDGFHKTMELLASRLGFEYRRRNRNGK